MGHTTVLKRLIWDFINTPNPSMNKTLWHALPTCSLFLLVRWRTVKRFCESELPMPYLWTAPEFQAIQLNLIVVNVRTRHLVILYWDLKEMWDVHLCPLNRPFFSQSLPDVMFSVQELIENRILQVKPKQPESKLWNNERQKEMSMNACFPSGKEKVGRLRLYSLWLHESLFF